MRDFADRSTLAGVSWRTPEPCSVVPLARRSVLARQTLARSTALGVWVPRTSPFKVDAARLSRALQGPAVCVCSILLLAFASFSTPAEAQVLVRGETVYTMAGDPIQNGAVLIHDGKIAAVGPAADIEAPAGFRVLEAKVVTPGLVAAHTVMGLAGSLNQPPDQDQVERSNAIQPELRAIDAYNPREPLIEWARSYGVTTLHTGHAPAALVAGQTMVVKTRGNSADEATIKPLAMIAAVIGQPKNRGANNKPPGTRGKAAAILRTQLLKAQQYAEKLTKEKKPDRDLKLEALTKIVSGETPLLVTAHRSQDILTAIRIAEEFEIDLVLDGVAEAQEVMDQIKASGVRVIVHPTMYRANGETENLSFETAAKLREASVPFALQSGYETYVPKSRLVLFEAALAAANGLSFEEALASITIDAARIIGVEDRVGSLKAGKDGDLALYDGDPFEYTSHCVGVVLEGEVVSEETK